MDISEIEMIAGNFLAPEVPLKRKRLRLKNGKLPKNLWVGKQLRNGASPRDESLVPAGKRPWQVWPQDYYPDYYFRLQKRGLPVVKRSTETDHYPTAVERAIRQREIWMESKWEKFNGPQPQMWQERPSRPAPAPKKELLAGEVFAAFLNIYGKKGMRPVQSARRLYVTAQGLVGWNPENPLSRKGAIQKGSPLIDLVDKTPFRKVFCPATVKDFFKVKQGGTYQPFKSSRDHGAYNEVYGKARELFSKEARSLCYEGIELPDLTDFLGVPPLKVEEADLRVKAIEPEEWEAMQAAAQKLLKSSKKEERELGLANWIARTLGLRTSEILNAKRSWLFQNREDGRWYLEIKNRPDQPYHGKFEEGATYEIKGAEAGMLPVHEDLLAVFLTRSPHQYLCYPMEVETKRHRLISNKHNQFVKSFIGHDAGHLGVHRLRAYVGTYIARNFGENMASTYLRHADNKKESSTARRHYIIPPEFAELPTVSDEQLMQWGRRTIAPATPKV